MFLNKFEISAALPVRDIVVKDYRAADVFRRHGISYCCGGKWPLDIACEARGVDAGKIQQELETATRALAFSTVIDYSNWEVIFLIDYIENIHHAYLKKCLPQLDPMLKDFVEEHVKQYPQLSKVVKEFEKLSAQLFASIEIEEQTIFPYVRQLFHSYKHKESYAGLLIRTLRQPVEELMRKGHTAVIELILALRNLTANYETPERACLSHSVVLSKLKELDADIIQHLFLEENVLFPKVAAYEKELMTGK